tara:strand:- start:456 stop:1301 length:846 start_codon:yes stop_codon:yes gene_type:complete
MKYLNLQLVIAVSLISVFATSPVLSQEMSMKSSSMQGGTAPIDARDPNEHSGGYEYRHMAGWEDTDEITLKKIIIDQFEYRDNDKGNNTLRWDTQGWYGRDYDKFWFKFEGEDEVNTNNGDLELQTLYSRSVAAFWDLQIGARYDRQYGGGSNNDQFFAVLGVQGLAPYWFEMEPALFIRDDGDVSARLVSTYDMRFTQRLILQPRLEMNASASEDRNLGIGKGINDLQLGTRLRYEIKREFAPYIGFEWQKQFGDTADFSRAEGNSIDNTAVVAGIKLWF